MPTSFLALSTGIIDRLQIFVTHLLRSRDTYSWGYDMTYNRYLLIKRWKSHSAPEKIRRLKPGTSVILRCGTRREVERVGIGRVLLREWGWVDWKDIDADSI